MDSWLPTGPLNMAHKILETAQSPKPPFLFGFGTGTWTCQNFQIFLPNPSTPGFQLAGRIALS